MHRHRLPFLLLLLVVGLFVAGGVVRGRLGIEFEANSIQQAISGLGWKAPAVFVALVVFRHFLLMPSVVVLSAGGVCFGTALGTTFGALGILLSAALKFGVGRGIGRDWLRPRYGQAMRALERRVETAGPFLVGLATAYPTGPMGPVHWASGFSTLAAFPFLVAVAVGAPLRAFAYSFFGSTLLAPGTPRFYVATLLLGIAALLPLAHPSVRRRLFASAD